MKKKNKVVIAEGLPFGPAQYWLGGQKTPIYYQHKYAAENWLNQLGKRNSMIIDTFLGKMKITRKILNDFLNSL